jgi:hypothetical protein
MHQTCFNVTENYFFFNKTEVECEDGHLFNAPIVSLHLLIPSPSSTHLFNSPSFGIIPLLTTFPCPRPFSLPMRPLR